MTEIDLQLWDACLETGLCDESTLEAARTRRAAAVGRGESMDLLGALAAGETLTVAQVQVLREAIPMGGAAVHAQRARPSVPGPLPMPPSKTFLDNVESLPEVEGLAVLDDQTIDGAPAPASARPRKLAPLPLDAELPPPDAHRGLSFGSIVVGLLALVAIGVAGWGAIYVLPELTVPDAPEVVDTPPPVIDSVGDDHPAMVALRAAIDFAEKHPDQAAETRKRLDALESAHAETLGAALDEARLRVETAHEAHRMARFERLQAKAERLRDSDPVGAALALLDFPEDLRSGPDGEKWAEVLAEALHCVRKKTGMALVPGGPAPSGSDSPGEPVAAFLVDLTEVSNSAYAEFVAATGARAPEHWRGDRPTTMLTSRPVVGITIAEARAYAEWAGKRLPSTLEWQLAAAGPEGWRYPWGETFDPDRCRAALGEKATPNGLAPTRTHADGRAMCGAYHLVGNASEWVDDVTTSHDGRVLHLALGGSALAEQPHTWQKDAYPSDTADPSLLIGFRCVKDAR